MFKRFMAAALVQTYTNCAREGNFTVYAISRHAHDALSRTFTGTPPQWVAPRIINATCLLKSRTDKPTLKDALQALKDA